MVRFFSMKSCRSRGSLSQLKAEFNRRNVSMDVNESFNHVWDFIQVLWFLIHCSLFCCMSNAYVYI